MMKDLLNKFAECIDGILDWLKEQASIFAFWYDEQDENTQNTITLIFALLTYILLRSAMN